MMRSIRWLALGLALFGGVLSAQERKKEDAPKQPAPTPTTAFTWENMLLAWIKFDKDFEYSDRRIDSYMRGARPETWNEVRNNEFKLQKARSETLEKLKKLVEDFKTEDEVVLGNARMVFGKYDFDLKGFPIETMTETFHGYTTPSRYVDHLPGTIKVYFTNTKAFNLIKIDKDKAETFIKSRTDQYGNVNREVFATIQFQLKKPKDLKNGEMLAEIRSMKVFHDSKKNKVLAEITLPEKE